MTSLTRGTLPPGVYWRRRLAVVTIVLLLVVGVSRMFGGGGDSGDSGDKAATVSAPSSATGSPTPSTAPSPGAGATSPAAPPATVATTPAVTTPPAPPPLPEPTGRCSDDDVVVTPSVTDAQATRTVLVHLTLRTLVTTACTWHTSARTLQVKITSGSDRIWSTIDCPHSIPSQDVVVRRDTDAVVNVGWSSRRSDESCSSHTKWAMPGFYHVAVAALGGEPQDVQFKLVPPRPLPKPAPTATPPAAPTSAPTAGPTAASTAGPRHEPQGTPKKKRKHRLVD
ncbi:hypothetical protein SAMN04487968_104241 [Nocardioides terrae]|uniref:Uncharacterized protein n=1 Tax=Nocardioides terrae TaxID=574651 RepID=A0A1I1HA58_9ACTN|nr:hypothetical protein [Nocardioides terrae]SFC20595.1 hypothetical protein SAMN04487968_104241 [Nocardioides terrae]